jgi:hypothetical protein
MDDKQAEIVIAEAKNHVKTTKRTTGSPIQALQDAVADVDGYRMASNTNQGYIFRRLLHDRLDYNHLIDQDVLISHFWFGVMNALLRAEVAGAEVPVRYDGTEPVTVTSVTSSGTKYYIRATQMSQLSYLRNTGLAYARRYIDRTCRERLRQQCLDCHQINPVGTTREYDNGCSCGSYESSLRSGWMKKRTRVCKSCGKARHVRMERVCGTPKMDGGNVVFSNGCGSEAVKLITVEKYAGSEAEEAVFANLVDEFAGSQEDGLIESEIHDDMNRFVTECERAMPKDPNDKTGDSKNRRIFRILVVPNEGADICRKCHENSPKLDGVPDPKSCCGATNFSLTSCINYSKKIGEYMGFTPTLANSRVKKIRKHTEQFATKNQNRFTTARYLATKLARGN